ncbi:hypothetical protein EVAR_102584_1 [Eumeta japonica]|uniref:Uncharacterized protein n=1 Tax=Eumeta variegata TaxID=151549 RepID=A0A4C1TVI1_EUMVA|nr:hypothetical protein EVAR_102584_1 [Eumeta japonica]
MTHIAEEDLTSTSARASSSTEDSDEISHDGVIEQQCPSYRCKTIYLFLGDDLIGAVLVIKRGAIAAEPFPYESETRI